MPYLLFLKKQQNFKLSSAANYRWRFKGVCFSTFQERINFEFEKMFETGVDEMSWDDTVGCIFAFICFVSVCHLSHMTTDI